MSDELVFMMGKFAARIPTDRLYAKNHMWAQPLRSEAPDPGCAAIPCRFGFSAYAVRLLQDVYFLEWNVDAGSTLAERQEVGAIESSKAESSLYAPAAGTLTTFNEQLLSDPSLINVDTYGQGWLFELVCSTANLLTPEQYLVHLEAAWKVAERTIKGQINED